MNEKVPFRRPNWAIARKNLWKQYYTSRKLDVQDFCRKGPFSSKAEIIDFSQSYPMKCRQVFVSRTAAMTHKLRKSSETRFITACEQNGSLVQDERPDGIACGADHILMAIQLKRLRPIANLSDASVPYGLSIDGIERYKIP